MEERIKSLETRLREVERYESHIKAANDGVKRLTKWAFGNGQPGVVKDIETTRSDLNMLRAEITNLAEEIKEDRNDRKAERKQAKALLFTVIAGIAVSLFSTGFTLLINM